MGLSFASKFSISLFVLSFIFCLISGNPAQALEEGDCFNTPTVVITGSITDASGVSEIIVTVDSPAPADFDIDNGNWTATFAGLSDGPHTLVVVGTDACGSGNTATTNPLCFEVDTAATVSITSPVYGATVYIGYTGDILVTGTADTDITTVTVTSDQGHSESSPVDIAGNWSVILTGCTVPSIVITAQVTDDCGNTGNDSVESPVIFAVCSISSVGPTTGCPEIAVTITGTTFGTTAGGVSFDSITATIISWSDTSIIVEAPGGGYSDVTVAPTIACLCSLSGIYYYDNDPPIGLAAAPEGGIYCTTPVTVSLTVSEGTIYYTTDNTEPTTGSPVYAGLIEIGMDTTLKFMAVDACGNQSYTVTEVYDIDDEAMVSITEPEGGLTIIAGDLWVTGTASTDITTVTVTSDQGHSESSGVDAEGNWSVVLSGITVPSIVITAQGTDDCGNIGSGLVTVPICEPTIWYVDITATGDNTGRSWDDAFTVIHDAVDVASSGDWIWVAEGTYTTDSTAPVLTMKSGVEIYGGFVGTESNLSERGDPAAHPAILDGKNTSYHVVIGTSNARLDGFIVKGGNARNYWPNSSGGGMYNTNMTNLVVANCNFSDNAARGNGGGIYSYRVTSFVVVNCIFSGNSANSYGGGIDNWSASPTIANCIFSGNSAKKGGGIYNESWYSSPTIITNCIFSGNSAEWGGGIKNYNYSSPTITNCIFSGNSAERGGGIDNSENCSPTITNCIFSGNSTEWGGGMSNYWGSSPEITNCIFSGNSAASSGGGMHNYLGSSPEITNCIFSGNSADYSGGGMSNSFSSSPEITNCTFGGNSAASSGGGMLNQWFSSPTITNCIMWDDTAPIGPEIALYSTGNPSMLTISYSDVQYGQMLVYVDPGCTLNWGAGMIGEDPVNHAPLFVTGLNGDYYLSHFDTHGVTSPCVDVGGDTAANLGLDDKTTRTDGVTDTGTVDMGYHYDPVDTTPPGVLVASPAGGAYCSPGVSVTSSCDDPEAMIYYTTDGTEPTTASSVYTGTIDISEDTVLKFMAVDAYGNQSSPVTEIYTIDIVANVAIIYPVDDITVYAGSVMVIGTADYDINTVTVTSDQGHSESSGVDAEGNWLVVLSGITVYSLVITAQGADYCGNIGSDSVTVFVIPEGGGCNISSVGPTGGCPGDAVTINGSGFGATEGTVSFDTTGASVTSWSDTSIVVSAPGGDYSNVTVTPTAAPPGSLTGTYSYDAQAPTDLTATPAGGGYSATPVTVSLTVSEGTIYYTLDGSEPTATSPVYAGPIDISEDTILKFMAVDACGNQASTVTEAYNIYIPGGEIDYMIITADNLAVEADEIRAYRESKGHIVGLLTMSEILAEMEGEEIEEELRARIRSVYEDRDPERPFFVLLVGDAEIYTSMDPNLIPAPRVTILDTLFTRDVVSDNWYADVDDDDIPDLAIGRLPFRESAEVELYLEKLVAYEGTYLPGEWNRRLSFFAGPSGFGEGMDSVLESIASVIFDRIPYTYNMNMTWAKETSPYLYVPEEFSDKVYERFNEGALAMTYIGHGSVGGINPPGGPPIFDTANLDSLDPVGRAPIFSMIACDTGYFIYNCLSELILAGDNGIPAIFSSAHISHPIFNIIVAMELEAAIFEAEPATLGEGLIALKDGMVNREGDGLRDIIFYLLIMYGWTDDEIVKMLITHIHMYTLFGDPALVIPFPRGEIFLTLDSQEYYAGETVFVEGMVDEVSDGEAIVSLEVARSVMAYPIEELDWSDPNVNDTIRTNYENANNKVLDAVTVDVVSGAFTASFVLPAELPPSTYHIKAYAYSTDTDAVGCTKLDLIP